MIHHVEEYARRPMNEDEYELCNTQWTPKTHADGFNFKPEAYYKMAKQWGAEVLAPRHSMRTPPSGCPVVPSVAISSLITTLTT